MFELVRELDAAGVPLFAITNFSGEFWREWVPAYTELFDRFRDVVVSGDEKLVKPDPAIYALALKRFGLEGPDAVFVDDSPANVEGANAAGIHGVLFTNAEDFRAELVRFGLQNEFAENARGVLRWASRGANRSMNQRTTGPTQRTNPYARG